MSRYFSTLPAEISDAQFFRHLELMRIQYLRRRRGWGGGERVTRRAGGSVEFAGHRDYNPGDDLRYLDWHLLARLDRPYIKTYHEEEYYYVHVLLDASKSMAGMAKARKFPFAQDVATALSYLILANDDRLKLAHFPGAREDRPFASTGRKFLLGKNKIEIVRQFVAATKPKAIMDFEAGFEHYVYHNRRRLGIVILISDFLAPLAAVQTGLLRFVLANSRPVVIRLLDAAERSIPNDRALVKVIDAETHREKVVTLNEANRREYEKAFESHRTGLQEFCAAHGVRYTELDTAENLYDSLAPKLMELGILRARRGG